MAKPDFGREDDSSDRGDYTVRREQGGRVYPEQQWPAARPMTPIPARASANPTGVVNVRSRYPRASVVPQDDDVTRIPTWPQPKDDDVTRIPTRPRSTIWQYETPDYEVGSSLSLLSIIVPDSSPTLSSTLDQPVEEMDTRPLAKSAQEEEEQEAYRLVRRDNRSSYKRSITQQPLERVRWWLLYPGRLEFLLWLGGTILLISVTAIFVLITALSMRILPPPALHSGVPGMNSVVTTPCDAPTGQLYKEESGSKNCEAITASLSSGLKVTLFNDGPLWSGESVHVSGQGFTALGRVSFTHDANQLCQPDSIQADAHGNFSVMLLLANGHGWEPGNHQLVVYDVVSRHSIPLTLMLTANPSASATVTVSPSPTPVIVTPTPDIAVSTTADGDLPPTATGTGPAPATATPVPVTHKPTPMPTKVPPTATPQAPVGAAPPTATPQAPVKSAPIKRPKPKPTPAVASFPTATPDSGSPVGTTPASTVAESLLMGIDSTLTDYSVPISWEFWLWVVLVGYGGAMLIWGVAKVLHQRNRAR